MKFFYIVSLAFVAQFATVSLPFAEHGAPSPKEWRLICKPVRLTFGDNAPILIEYGAHNRVARITDSEHGYYETFEYNAEGKVVRIDYHFGAGNALLERCVFEYTGETFVRRKHYKVDAEGGMADLGHCMEYTLDEQGRITKSLWLGGAENVPYFYSYNADGNITRVYKGGALSIEYKAHDSNKQPLYHAQALKFSNMIGTRNGEMLGTNNPTEAVIKGVSIALSYSYNINKYPVSTKDNGGIFSKTVSYAFD
jgi:hypothetical protein